MLSGRTSESKDGPALIPAVFASGERLTDRGVVAVTALGLDIDGDASKGQSFLALDQIARLFPFTGVAYSTFSSTPKHPRYRVLFPFAEELHADAFRAVWDWANDLTGGVVLDRTCKNPSRLFYTPRSPPGAQAAGWPWAKVLEGRFLSLRSVPDAYLQRTRPAGAGGCKPSRTKRQGAHRASADVNEAGATLERTLSHPVVDWAIANATDVTREVWRGIATNLVCACDGHEVLLERAWAAFDAVSAADPTRYRRGDAWGTWLAAIQSADVAGPMTFAHMQVHGLPAELCSRGATCLVHAARRGLRAMRAGMGSRFMENLP